MSISYNLPNLLQLHGNMYDFSSFELKAELSIFITSYAVLFCKPFTFSSSPEPLSQLQPDLAQSIPK